MASTKILLIMWFVLLCYITWTRGNDWKPDPKFVYPIFARMMKDAANQIPRDEQLPKQYVAGLLLSPEEMVKFDPNKLIQDVYPGRFHVYGNSKIEVNGKKEDEHGEVKLLNSLDDVFYQKYWEGYTNKEDAPQPFLLLYTTNIPCHRIGASKIKTCCSCALSADIQKRRGGPSYKSYKLLIAFIGVYSRSVEKGKRLDFTDLTKSLQALTSLDMLSDIGLAYFVAKNDNQLLPGSQESQEKIQHDVQGNEYGLSVWIDNKANSLAMNQLIRNYPQCCPVQDALFACLMIFLGGCECLGNSQEVIPYYINRAMLQCVHVEGAPLKKARNPIKKGDRNKLIKCLQKEMVDPVGFTSCNNCQGDSKDLIEMCLGQSLKSQNVACPPTPNQSTRWMDCDQWDNNYGFIETMRKPRCGQPSSNPENLCSIPSKKPKLDDDKFDFFMFE